MLRGLFAAGVRPDILIGGSVGAINAAFLAADPTPGRVDELADRWAAMTSRTLLGVRRTAMANLARRRPYLFDSAPLRRLVEDWIGVSMLEDLSVRTLIATTDLGTGRPVHHERGRLAEIVAASAALPGVFPPTILPGADSAPTRHVDAGIAENVPLTAANAIARPGDRVFVLDATKTGLHRDLRTPIDVLVAALMATVANQPAVVFEPGVEVIRLRIDDSFSSGHVLDFTHVRTLIQLGERCALNAMTYTSRPDGLSMSAERMCAS